VLPTRSERYVLPSPSISAVKEASGGSMSGNGDCTGAAAAGFVLEALCASHDFV
jgi:hypothetical protein